jgi:hypothetical protein
MSGACYDEKFSTDVVRYAIIDNKVYLQSGMTSQWHINDRIKLFQGYLNKIVSQFVIPDTYFIIGITDQIVEEYVVQKDKHKCRALPFFMFGKNTSNEFERKTFLMPDTYVINQLYMQNIGEVKRMSKNQKWE